MKDQNGTEHDYAIHGVGRLLSDTANRLVQVTDGDAVDVSCEYDGLHRKIVRTDNTIAGGSQATLEASTTDSYYAGQQVLEERERSPLPLGEGQGEGWADGASYQVVQYVWSARYIDAPVLRDRVVYTWSETSEEWTAAEDRHYYLTDANHNVTALTDDSGAVIERYSYDAFGAVTVYDDDWSNPGTESSVGNTVLFAGMQRDELTNAYYARARWYNPSTGGFISRDPVEGDANLYRYCGNNPTQYTDPSGLYASGGGTPAPTPSNPPAKPETPQPGTLCDLTASSLSPAGVNWTGATFNTSGGVASVASRTPFVQNGPDFYATGASTGTTPTNAETGPIITESGDVFGYRGVLYTPPGTLAFVTDNQWNNEWRWSNSNRFLWITPIWGWTGPSSAEQFSLWASNEPAVFEGISGWDELDAVLTFVPDNSLNMLVIVGHGSTEGGVNASRELLQASTLTKKPGVAALIKRKLKTSGLFVVGGCQQGASKLKDEMEQLAEIIDRRVVGNDGNTNGGILGHGNWRVFYPSNWQGPRFYGPPRPDKTPEMSAGPSRK